MKKPSLLPAVIGIIIYVVGTRALLIISAGTADWPLAWVYVGLSLAATLGGRLVVFFRNLETQQERASFTQSEGVTPRDRFGRSSPD